MLFFLIVEITLRQRVVCQKSLHVSISTSWTFHVTFRLLHCVKSVHIQSFSGPYFPTFGLNTERYGVSLRIQSECGKLWIKKLQIRTLHEVKIRVWNTTETNGRVPACDRFYINFWDKIVMSWEFLTSPDFITNLYWPKPFTYSKTFRVSYQYEKVLK